MKVLKACLLVCIMIFALWACDSDDDKNTSTDGDEYLDGDEDTQEDGDADESGEQLEDGDTDLAEIEEEAVDDTQDKATIHTIILNYVALLDLRSEASFQSKLAGHISENYNWAGLNKADFVVREIAFVTGLKDITYNFTTDEITVSGNTAEAKANFDVTYTFDENATPKLNGLGKKAWIFSLARENKVWKITALKNGPAETTITGGGYNRASLTGLLFDSTSISPATNITITGTVKPPSGADKTVWGYVGLEWDSRSKNTAHASLDPESVWMLPGSAKKKALVTDGDGETEESAPTDGDAPADGDSTPVDGDSAVDGDASTDITLDFQLPANGDGKTTLPASFEKGRDSVELIFMLHVKDATDALVGVTELRYEIQLTGFSNE